MQVGRSTVKEPLLASEYSPTVWSARHLRAATDAAGVAMWSWNVDSDVIAMDERGYLMWEVAQDEALTFEVLSKRIHPADLDRVRSAFAATRAIMGAYEIDFRILSGTAVRWVSARGQGDDADIAERLMFGIFLDVTQRKQAEEANALLAGEMSHRVKNLLMIAYGLTQSVARSATTKEELAHGLAERLIALGRAHDLVRPTGGEESEALLGDLLAILLAPYDGKDAAGGRIRIAVPKIGVGSVAATTLALAVHELATNSMKYGALSVPNGVLDVACDPFAGDEVALVWTEHGGPPVVAPPAAKGFGVPMLHRSIGRTFGGSITFAWPPEGAIVTLRMKLDRLAA